MHARNEEVRILCRDKFEELDQRQFRADVRREAGQHCWRKRGGTGDDSKNCSMRRIYSGEEGFDSRHRALDIGLAI